MKIKAYKFEKFLAVLTIILFFIAVINVPGAEPKAVDAAKIRAPETAHYSRLAQLDASEK